MSVTFSISSDGNKTCAVNNIRLHSAYNPIKEAERFVANIECDFNPISIIVTEPALSYCVPFLKSRFKNAKCYAIRFSCDFDFVNSNWDTVFYTKNLSEKLFSFFGEEGLLQTLFVSWTASQKAFPNEYELCWEEIKRALQKSRDVLATRSYFSKRWAKNSLRFAFFSKQFAQITKGNCPVVICASGQSLKTSLKSIKERRSHFFLIAVSSAISVLISNGIFPDLCVSTDGGFWAKFHLKKILKYNSIPLSLSPESACFAKILSENTIIPLSYSDGFAEDTLNYLKIKTQNAMRNGTVSGTAADIALKITSGNVFFCGLDLANSNGFSHTEPNELENYNSTGDFRFSTKETRIVSENFSSGALNLYRDWFSSYDFKNRLFRLSNNFSYCAELKNVPSVNWDFFDSQLDSKLQIFPKIMPQTENCLKKNLNNLKNFLNNYTKSENWVKEALPAETIAFSRSLSNSEEKEKRLQQKKDEYLCDIKRAIKWEQK